LLRQTFYGILRRSGTHQFACILWDIHPAIDRFRADVLAIQGTQESRHDLPDAAIAIRIPVPIPQHHIVLSAKVVVSPILRKQQPIQEQRVAEIRAASRLFAKQRSPRARERTLLHFAQAFKDFLPGFSENDSLSYLERRDALAIFMRAL